MRAFNSNINNDNQMHPLHEFEIQLKQKILNGILEHFLICKYQQSET